MGRVCCICPQTQGSLPNPEGAVYRVCEWLYCDEYTRGPTAWRCYDYEKRDIASLFRCQVAFVRVMRQNRRLKHGDTEERRTELEVFHGVLEDISQAKCTDRVREFFIAAYVRGACQTAHVAELEGSVAVMTKRRYRDAWNRVVCRRIARVHGHSLKIRSRVQAAHAKREWYKERHARVILSPYSHIRPSKG